MTAQSTPTTVAEVWDIFKEVAAGFKDIEARFKETDAKFKETDAKFKETDAKFKETDAKFKETDAKFKDTDRALRRLEGLFTSQWGKMIEALVQPSATRLFRERGIEVHYAYPRAKSQQNGETMEIDILLENGRDVIVVEVKTTLRIKDVDEFLVDLQEFRRFFPKYAGFHLYGAVAALQIDENADRYAYKQGLFVLSVMGEGVVQIKNDKQFRPRDYQFQIATE